MEIAVICIYMAVLLGIGVYYSRKIANFDDFSVAGRNIAWPLLLATSAATMIGGGASMGSRMVKIFIRIDCQGFINPHHQWNIPIISVALECLDVI